LDKVSELPQEERLSISPCSAPYVAIIFAVVVVCLQQHHTFAGSFPRILSDTDADYIAQASTICVRLDEGGLTSLVQPLDAGRREAKRNLGRLASGTRDGLEELASPPELVAGEPHLKVARNVCCFDVHVRHKLLVVIVRKNPESPAMARSSTHSA
jgi:hypothetical protein